MRNSKCSGCNEPLWVDISDTSYNGSMRRLSTSWKAQREGVWLVDEGHYQGVLAFASPTDSSDVQGSHSPHQRDQPTPRRLPGHHLADAPPASPTRSTPSSPPRTSYEGYQSRHRVPRCGSCGDERMEQ